jgi:GT2 family glycosyltransferase
MRARYAPVGVYRAATEKELIGCNLSIRRQTLEAIGGFCEDMFPNDETELLGRLVHQGHRVMYDPALIVRRAQRHSWRSLARQFFTYGQGRLRQIRRTPTARVMPFLMPALGLVYLALLPLLLWKLGAWIMLPLAAYLATILLSSVWLGLMNHMVVGCVILPIVFGLIHACYGYGLIYESLMHRLRRQAQAAQETVVVSRV